MFNHPFYAHAPSFAAHVRIANDGRLDKSLRHVAFAQLAHDLLGWFFEHPALESVKLTALSLPELEDQGRAVRIRHHFKLVAAGHELTTGDQYFLDSLPWVMMGSGVFVLQRSDAAVQSFLAYSALDADAQDPLAYEAMVHGLALRIDAAFTEVLVQHDLGLASSTR